MLNKNNLFDSLFSRITRRGKLPSPDTAMGSQQNKAESFIVSELDKYFCTIPRSEKDLWRAKAFSIKEPETNAWLRDEINEESVFWDIGANIGLFSLYAATLNKKCKILAFEPESQNFASLCGNVFANEFLNIEAYGIAIAGGPASFQDLYVSEMSAGSAVHNIGCTSPWAPNQAVFRQKTIAISVDELVSKFGFPAPTIMKIDVDGIELDILRGARMILSGSLQTVLVEMDAEDYESMDKLAMIMSDSKFSLLAESNRPTRVNEKLPRNYIWKR